MTSAAANPYPAFWSRYVNRARQLHPEWTAVGTATTENYIYQPSGFDGCRIAPGFKGDGRLSHELVVMDRDGDLNLQIYGALRAHRGEFEQAYGRRLTWDPRPGAKRCLIGEYGAGSLKTSPSDQTIDDYIDWFVDCGARLRHAVAQLGWLVEALT